MTDAKFSHTLQSRRETRPTAPARVCLLPRRAVDRTCGGACKGAPTLPPPLGSRVATLPATWRRESTPRASATARTECPALSRAGRQSARARSVAPRPPRRAASPQRSRPPRRRWTMDREQEEEGRRRGGGRTPRLWLSSGWCSSLPWRSTCPARRRRGNAGFSTCLRRRGGRSRSRGSLRDYYESTPHRASPRWCAHKGATARKASEKGFGNQEGRGGGFGVVR